MSKSVKGKSKAVTVLIQNEAKADGEFYSTQGFESRESDDEDPETKLWDVVDILDERNGFFLIKWAGVDEHGEPWKNSWVPRVDVTDDLVKEWRMKKATATKMKGLEKGKGKDSTEDGTVSRKEKKSGKKRKRDLEEQEGASAQVDEEEEADARPKKKKSKNKTGLVDPSEDSLLSEQARKGAFNDLSLLSIYL